jgi:Clustered mitochondria/Translation initiation factor eIF3 subunit 135
MQKAIDANDLYGSDYAAAKAAGHELKGVSQYMNCGIGDLCLPLMALVDYMGYRLVALSLLPIGSDTIVYGSNDGGNTMHASSSILNERMELAARKLNLATHIGGVQVNSTRRVYSAADIEGHHGTDGRYYLLDLARTFPPETPQPRRIRNGHLWRMLRPEWVRRHPRPLSSDAFSSFAINDPDMKAQNAEVAEATKQLLSVGVRRCCKEAAWEVKESLERDALSSLSVTTVLHRRGVNMRHLGAVASFCNLNLERSVHCYRALLIEAAARVIKNRIRACLRAEMRRLRQPVEVPYRRVVVRLLNLVFGASQRSALYWQQFVWREMVDKFGFCTEQQQQQPADKSSGGSRSGSIDSDRASKRLSAGLLSSALLASAAASASSDSLPLAKSVDSMLQTPASPDTIRALCLSPITRRASGVELLFRRVCALVGLSFSRDAMRKIERSAGTLARPLSLLDLESIAERVKHANLIELSCGKYLMHKASSSVLHSSDDATSASVASALELLERAIAHFNSALISDPTNPEALKHCALSWARLLALRAMTTALSGAGGGSGGGASLSMSESPSSASAASMATSTSSVSPSSAAMLSPRSSPSSSTTATASIVLHRDVDADAVRNIMAGRSGHHRRGSIVLSSCDPQVRSATTMFRRAIEAASHRDVDLNIAFAEFSSQCGQTAIAEQTFLRTLESFPRCVPALVAYGTFLMLSNRQTFGKRFLLKAREFKAADQT